MNNQGLTFFALYAASSRMTHWQRLFHETHLSSRKSKRMGYANLVSLFVVSMTLNGYVFPGVIFKNHANPHLSVN